MTERQNPFPGPRPLDAADSSKTEADRAKDQELLKGRQDDIDELMSLLTHRQLVVLTADSGIGKTSVIKAGLIPQLRDAGYAVCYFDKWRTLSKDSGSANLMQAMHASDIGEGLADQWSELLSEGQRPNQAMSALQTRFGNRLIVIFDQLEELFRLDPDLGRDFIGSLCRLLTTRKYSIRFITSLRREFRFELGLIERSLQPSEWFAKELQSIELAALPQIVRGPLAEADWGVSDECAGQLADAWKIAAFDTVDAELISQQSRAAKVGLIHMQALLWSMWELAEHSTTPPETSARLSWADLARLTSLTGQDLGLTQIEPRSEPRMGLDAVMHRTAFQRALEAYVELQMEALRQHCAASGGPDSQRIADETLACASEIAPHLSSGTYKVIVDADDLALDAAIGFEVLDLSDGSESAGSLEGGPIVGLPKRLVRAVRQVCISDATNAEGATLQGVISPDDPAGDFNRCWERLHSSQERHQLSVEAEYLEGVQRPDERIRASGRLRDARPLRIGIELGVTYARSLLWLERAHVIRFTPGLRQHGDTGFRELSISAIHDGFGVALRSWGESASTRPEVCGSQLVALRGEQLLRRPRGEGSSARRLVKDTTFDNAVWQGCIITADLKNVTFRNCDLRGLLLHDCDFDNVAFEDCITWGMLIQRSRVFDGGITVTASTDDDSASLKGLTFQNGCVFGPGTTGLPPEQGGFHAEGPARENRGSRDVDSTQGIPLVLEGLRGYGLFASATQGANWQVRDCHLAHTSLGQGERVLGSCRIEGGSLEMVTFGSFADGLELGEDVRRIHIEPAELEAGSPSPSASDLPVM